MVVGPVEGAAHRREAAVAAEDGAVVAEQVEAEAEAEEVAAVVVEGSVRAPSCSSMTRCWLRTTTTGDEEDDIGEYDDQPAAVSHKPKPAPLRHTASTPATATVSLSAATALSSVTAIRQSQVSAKKKRGGWDEVDIGELTIHQMDQQIEVERKQQEAQRLAVERSRQWNTVSHQDAVNAQYQSQLQRPPPQQQRSMQPSPAFSARGRTSFSRGGPRAGIPIVPTANVRLAGQHAGLGLSADYAGGRRIDSSAKASGNLSVGKKRKAGEPMVRDRPQSQHANCTTACQWQLQRSLDMLIL